MMTEIPLLLNTPEFKEAWELWQQHRKEIRHSLTPSTIRLQLKKLEKMGASKAIASINQSVENGYQGLFEPSYKAAIITAACNLPEGRE